MFIAGLIVFGLLTANVSDRVLDSRVGAIDRTWASCIGLVRGLILVVIAYIVASHWLDASRAHMRPLWLQEPDASVAAVADAGARSQRALPASAGRPLRHAGRDGGTGRAACHRSSLAQDITAAELLRTSAGWRCRSRAARGGFRQGGPACRRYDKDAAKRDGPL